MMGGDIAAVAITQTRISNKRTMAGKKTPKLVAQSSRNYVNDSRKFKDVFPLKKRIQLTP